MENTLNSPNIMLFFPNYGVFVVKSGVEWSRGMGVWCNMGRTLHETARVTWTRPKFTRKVQWVRPVATLISYALQQYNRVPLDPPSLSYDRGSRLKLFLPKIKSIPVQSFFKTPPIMPPKKVKAPPATRTAFDGSIEQHCQKQCGQ
jgi:hypothetical protein